MPLQVFSDRSKLTFLFSTLLLGLADGFAAYQTASAKWSVNFHSLNGILALNGMISSNILKLLRSY